MEEHILGMRRLDGAYSRRRPYFNEDEAAGAPCLLKPAGYADGVALINAHPAPREPGSQECCGARDALEHGVSGMRINKPLRRLA